MPFISIALYIGTQDIGVSESTRAILTEIIITSVARRSILFIVAATHGITMADAHGIAIARLATDRAEMACSSDFATAIVVVTSATE